MKDEFRLTPIDIRAQEFHRAALGYNRAHVDDFRERVAQELERLLRDRMALDERVQNLREQLKAFREREKALNDALVAAQQLRAETEVAARKEAEIVLREARVKADEIVQLARDSEANVRRDTEATQRHFTAYLASFRALLERYLAEVDALDAHQRDGSPPAP